MTLEIAPVGNEPLDTRDRRTINGGGNEADMWRDFIYVPRSLTAAEGLDLRVSGLIPFATYPVIVWGYDTSSRDERRSTWNGTISDFNIGWLQRFYRSPKWIERAATTPCLPEQR